VSGHTAADVAINKGTQMQFAIGLVNFFILLAALKMLSGF